MVQSNGSGNGNQQDYDPGVEFIYLDADVWYEDRDGRRSIAYTEQVEDAIEQEEDESSNSDE
jgi:hypothetical protein